MASRIVRCGLVERAELARAVVDETHGRRETQLTRPLRNDQRVRRIANARANDRVDGDVELRVLREPAQLLIEHLQALHRHVVRLHVVDADLQMVEAGAVQPSNPVARQQVSVRDQRGDGAAPPDVADDRVEVGMEQRLAAADGDDAGAQVRQAVDAPEHLVRRYRRRVVVVLVAVAARQVAAADWNQMSVDGLVLEAERPDQHPGFPHATCPPS